MKRFGWEIVHVMALSSWGCATAMILFEIITTGGLHRSAQSGGVYDARSVLSIGFMFGISALSAGRALFIEIDRNV